MTRLEDLLPTASVRGILPDQIVTVVSVQWFGAEALELTYKGVSVALPMNYSTGMTSRGCRSWSTVAPGALTGMDIYFGSSQRRIVFSLLSRISCFHGACRVANSLDDTADLGFGAWFKWRSESSRANELRHYVFCGEPAWNSARLWKSSASVKRQ